MIRAYPGRPSVFAGEHQPLHVATDARKFGVSFVRWGSTLQRFDAGRLFDGFHADPEDAGVPWDWPQYEFEIPADWRGGVYVALLADESKDIGGEIDARSARALFTVRREDSTARLLVVLPLFTYHAYNVADVDGTRREEEGRCLYSGSPWVSVHRPGGGTGGHPWDEVNVDVYDASSPRQTFAHWDAKAIQWLEEERFDYDCVTDLELHDASFDLGRYEAIVSFGHHEYWTQEMRDRVEAFLRGGGNVAFFGGNTCWFRAHYDEATKAVRRTGRWTDIPEWKFTGVTYACGGGKWIGARPPSGYRVREAAHWLFDGLNVSAGDVFGARERLIGYECDGAPEGSDLEIAAEASIAGWPVEDGSGEVSAQARATLGVRTASGSLFTASTVDWARLLREGDPVVEGITRNVLRRFLRP